MVASALFACGTAVTNTGVTGGGSSSGGGSLLPGDLVALVTYAAAVTILSLGILALALVVIFARRGGPKPLPVPIGATVSPDGLYWWDGTSWRPVSR